MKYDIDRVVVKNIERLNRMLARYNVTSAAEFLRQAEEDEVFEAAVTSTVGYIGELCGRLKPELKAAHEEINWQRLRKSRNVIVHDYETVNYIIVADVIFIDIPAVGRLLGIEGEPSGEA